MALDASGLGARGRNTVGSEGELVACEFLQGKGFTILERNFRRPWGELDAITRSPEGTLVFVEVKTLGAGSTLSPEDEMTKAKTHKTRRIAELYANAHPEEIKTDRGWRIDLVGIVLTDPPTIRHYEGV